MVFVARTRDYAIIAPDGGWGWVIVIASFTIQLIVDGVMLTFGFVIEDMSDYYDLPQSTVAFIGSVTFGGHLFFGPLCELLLKHWGERKTVMIGSFLSGTGLLVAYFKPPYAVLFLSQGIMTGIGLCLANMSSIILTTLYFSKKRIFALAIVVSGTGAGTIVFSLVSSYILEHYEWHNVFLVESIVCYSMTFLALVYVPLVPMEIRIERKEGTAIEICNISVHEDDEDTPISVQKPSTVQSEPEHARVFYISDPDAINPRHTAGSLETLNSVEEYNQHVVESYAASCIHTEVPRQGGAHRWLRKLLRRLGCRWCIRQKRKIVIMAQNTAGVLESKDRCSLGVCEILSIDAEPLLSQPSQQQSQWVRFKAKMRNLGGFRPLMSWPFLTFCICGALSYSGIYIVFSYEKERISIHEHGSESDVAEYLIVIGAANVVCRCLLGFSGFCELVDFQVLNIVGHIIGGIATIISGLSHAKAFQYSMAGAFAFSYGCFAVFAPIILYELVGVQSLNKATGFSMMFNGLISAMAPGFSGMIAEAVNEVNINFYIAGAMLIASGILFQFIIGKRQHPQHHTPRHA